MDFRIQTGNPIVDAVGKLNISGNITPEAWYHTIVTDSGKADMLAIAILSDITYWYRPTEVRNETDLSVSYIKKFSDKDYLQRSYSQLSEKFNITKKQAYDRIVLLEKLGVIKRHFRTIPSPSGPLANVMYIELIPDILESLTFPKGGPYKIVDTPLHDCRDTPSKKKTPPSQKEDTYTNITTEISTEISSTAVAEAKELFSDLNISDRDINSILKTASNDIEKCKAVRNQLNRQHSPINNVVGWIISALKNNYSHVSLLPKPRNTFNDLMSRNYSKEEYDEMEKIILADPPGCPAG